jgi:hypothetical protein
MYSGGDGVVPAYLPSGELPGKRKVLKKFHGDRDNSPLISIAVLAAETTIISARPVWKPISYAIIIYPLTGHFAIIVGRSSNRFLCRKIHGKVMNSCNQRSRDR